MHEVLLEAPDDETVEELLDRYESALAAVLDDVGPERAAEAAGVEIDAVEDAAAGDAAELDLRAVAAILALGEEAPDADAILGEVRDGLLLGMSSAVLDVDRVAAGVAGGLDPKEVQGKIEGRHPMTLAEYARLRHYVASAA